ncbi:hypothetical protein TrCOL_g576 [Triparma columacea]|uniref:Uncharacterized protein n=1 Tax=Triparma columacea TaxID=722753 RepID=A0A9W7LA83_9STRA|nr:hypothetical protein TrCOL_g576 [Triparma columacea]
MISCKVDAVEWRQELERVGPRLRVKGFVGDWRSRLLHLGRYVGDVEGMGEGVKGLKVLQTKAREDVDRVKRGEVIINGAFGDLSEEREVYRKAEGIALGMREKEEEERDRLALELSDVVGKLEEVKDKIDVKSDTDTTPIVRMREGLKFIKQENKDLEIEIGVLYNVITKLGGRRAYVNIEDSDDG